MPQLDPTWFASQIFWLAISFIALYLVLARHMLPPLQGMLARREETVASDLETAKNMTRQAEQAKVHYERALSEARGKAQELFAEALAEQKASADKAAAAMDKQIAAKVSEAEKTITAKKTALLDALVPMCSELASMIVEKLSGTATNGNTTTGSLSDESLKSRRR
jgi:F-type H+-transporting ATPase subunit b